MSTRLSKLMRNVIIANFIITLIAITIHGYYMHRIFETYGHIDRVMTEKQVIRDTAIRMLEKEGVDLFFGRGMSATFGIFVSLLTLLFLYIYSQTNGFFAGFFAAFCAIFASYVGGLLLFYVFFSGKSERPHKNTDHLIKNEWQMYIHKRSVLI